MTTPTELLQDIQAVRNNPLQVQQVILDHLENATDGNITISDPSNPFVFLLEAGVICSTAGMAEAEALSRRQYKELAQNDAELYYHMSDVDYLNRFGSPARGNFAILLSKAEVYQRAVATGVDNIRKIVIPRDTTFTVEGFTFTMLYPIEIRIMSHNGLQVVYDVSKPSPIETLSTNLVKWNVTTLQDTGDIEPIELIRINIPINQLFVTRVNENINQATAFTHTATFPDNYYYTRVFHTNNAGRWVEMRTTHTDQVYDASRVTAVLQVIGSNVKIHIPPIYFSKGMVGDSIRIDVYSNKGPLAFDLSSYIPNSYKASFDDFDGDTDTKYTAPLSDFNIIGVFGYDNVKGGSLPLSFTELRKRTINNSLSGYELPITEAQLTSTLEDRGYRMVTNVDVITNRVILATRALPNPKLPNNASGAGCIMGVFQSRIEDLVQLPTVNDNVTRMTILPTTLYRNNDGVISIVPKAEVDALLAATPEARVSAVNAANFLYTPFHYVYDPADNRFEVRAYYLDSPVIETKEFIDANNTAAIEISTGTYEIFKRDEGYELIVVCASGDSWKTIPNAQITVQLSYRATNESTYAHLNGTLVGTDPVTNERVYSFVLESNFDLTNRDELYINNFKMFNNDTIRELTTSLTTDFYITYIVTDYSVNGLPQTNIDRHVATFLLPSGYNNYVGATREQLTIAFGYSLDGLWTKSRTVASEIDYEKWLTNVPYVYAEDVYERNLDGSRKVIINGSDIEFVLLHAAGDIKEEDGQVVYRYLAGDVKRDSAGSPIPKNARSLLRHAELFFVDGRFYFATDASTLAYRESIPKTIVDWLKLDLAVLSEKLLEETELLFYPLTTTGNIKVIASTLDPISIPAEQSFTIQLSVDRSTHSNMVLRATMVESITAAIAAALTEVTTSTSDMIATMKATLGSGVKGITLSGLGGNRVIDTLTVLDDSQRAVLRKKLVVSSDGTLSVQDDIAVDFVLHALV